MLGRFALVGFALAALGAPAVQAGSTHVPIWLLKKQCEASYGSIKLCAHQFAYGSRNWAVTKQKTELGYSKSSTVFSVTIQNGDDNAAYTGQYGKDLSAKIIQNGNDNRAGILQVGKDLKTTIVQNGDSNWSVASTEGDDAKVKVIANSY